MTTGKNHAKITLTSTPFIALAVGAVTLDPIASVITVIGSLTGLYVHPDLDIQYVTSNPRTLIHSHRKVLNTFGDLGWLWVALWWPYAKLIPHRSMVSHYPIYSTIIRLLYLGVLSFGLWRLSGYYFWYFFIGLCVSDILHWLADGRPS
jgi:uncharacterized metal-binding protein